MIVISAILEAKPGMESKLQALLEAMVAKVKSEPGAQAYTLHRAQDNPARFFFYECYTDQAAVDHHCATPYFQELFATIPDMLAGEPQIAFYEKLTGLDR